MKSMMAALLALCFILLGVNDAAAGANKKGKGVPTALVPTPTPVDGECGSNASTYRANDTAFSGKFCKVGEQSQTSIAFPEQGHDILWTCQGQEGGKPAVCVAAREAPPKVMAFKLPPPAVLECKWVPIPATSQYETARTFVVPGLLINTNCGKQTVWLNGTQYTQPAQVLNSSGMQLVCPEPSN